MYTFQGILFLLHRTVRVATLDVVPSTFTATQAISPTCIDEAIVIIRCPPAMVIPVSSDVNLRLSSNHWNSAGGLASASHVNVTDEFSGTVIFTGPCIMLGRSTIEIFCT